MIPKDKVKEILLKHELLEKELSSVNVEPKKYALKSNLIDRVIVSTDSNKIRNYSNKFGNLSPFLRPKKLSGSEVGKFDVWKHALIEAENSKDSVISFSTFSL